MLVMNHRIKNNYNINKVLCKIVGVDILVLWVLKLLKNKHKVKLYLLVLKHLGYKLLKI